jgi:hypothetical protein
VAWRQLLRSATARDTCSIVLSDCYTSLGVYTGWESFKDLEMSSFETSIVRGSAIKLGIRIRAWASLVSGDDSCALFEPVT